MSYAKSAVIPLPSPTQTEQPATEGTPDLLGSPKSRVAVPEEYFAQTARARWSARRKMGWGEWFEYQMFRFDVRIIFAYADRRNEKPTEKYVVVRIGRRHYHYSDLSAEDFPSWKVYNHFGDATTSEKIAKTFWFFRLLAERGPGSILISDTPEPDVALLSEYKKSAERILFFIPKPRRKRSKLPA